MQLALQKTISSHGKLLIMTAVSFMGEPIPESVIAMVESAFHKLSPFFRDSQQTIYLRDIKSLAIDGSYPGGHCYNQHEVMIALPSWDIAERQVIATISHELHHLARRQNAGYGKSLGGAILSEGIATLYGELESGWAPPWSQAHYSKETLTSAIDNWTNEQYDHREWFFKSRHGRWLGYAIGYQLAKEIYKSGFDLGNSLELQSDDVNSIAANISGNY